MTIIRNPNYVEGVVVESRIGWWRFRDEAYARSGEIDVRTRKPIEPRLIVEGQHPTGGEFLGWVADIANRCDGFKTIPEPIPRVNGLALLVPEELDNFRQARTPL